MTSSRVRTTIWIPSSKHKAPHMPESTAFAKLHRHGDHEITTPTKPNPGHFCSIHIQGESKCILQESRTFCFRCTEDAQLFMGETVNFLWLISPESGKMINCKLMYFSFKAPHRVHLLVLFFSAPKYCDVVQLLRSRYTGVPGWLS